MTKNFIFFTKKMEIIPLDLKKQYSDVDQGKHFISDFKYNGQRYNINTVRVKNDGSVDYSGYGDCYYLIAPSNVKDITNCDLHGNRIYIDRNLNFEVAAYGNMLKQTTEVDQTIRKGLVIKPIHISTCDTERIISHILKYCSLKVKLIPHALNIYTEGDHFKSHVDTPRHDAARMIGTVVCVIINHSTGGDFIYNDNKITLNEGNYIFFKGDIEHSVTPIISGCRITVTFDVLIENTNFDINKYEVRLFNEFIGQQFVVALTSRYTLEAIKQEVMKNEYDIVALQKIKNLGLPYKFVRLTVEANINKFFEGPSAEYVLNDDNSDEDLEFDYYDDNDGYYDYMSDSDISESDVGKANGDGVKIYSVKKKYQKKLLESSYNSYKSGDTEDNYMVSKKFKITGEIFEGDDFNGQKIVVTKMFNFGTIDDFTTFISVGKRGSFYMGNQHDKGIKISEYRVYQTIGILVN